MYIYISKETLENTEGAIKNKRQGIPKGQSKIIVKNTEGDIKNKRQRIPKGQSKINVREY